MLSQINLFFRKPFYCQIPKIIFVWLYNSKICKRIIQEMEELIRELPENPGSIETRAAGSILHDFYCGIEKIFERIAIAVDKNWPEGEGWHKQLQRHMAIPY